MKHYINEETIDQLCLDVESNRTIGSKYFLFRQNNSFGTYNVDKNLAEYVVIEAKSVNDSNKRAENIGIYFDGCRDNIDCSCCGDRWYICCFADAYDSIIDVIENIFSFDSTEQIRVHTMNGNVFSANLH
jgi:hypothetical protein